jgi:hypothetical protein
MFSISNRKQWIFLSPICLSVILEYLVLRANCQLTVANAECLFHLPSHLIVCKTHAPLYHLFTREITFPHWPVNNLHFSPDEGSLIYLIFQCQIVCGAQALIVSNFYGILLSSCHCAFKVMVLLMRANLRKLNAEKLCTVTRSLWLKQRWITMTQTTSMNEKFLGQTLIFLGIYSNIQIWLCLAVGLMRI